MRALLPRCTASRPKTWQAATCAYPGYPRRLEITGTGGTVIVAGDRIVAADLKKPVSLPPAEPADQNPSTDSPIVSDVRGHASVIADFMAAIRNHTAPRCNGREGRRSVALVEAIYAAARASS